MRARLLRMQAAALDRLDELGEELVRLQERCGGTADGYNAQLADAEARYRDAQAALAEAVKLQAENEEQSRLKSLQLQDLTKDYGETLSTCKANLQHSEAEICNIRKLRAELYSAAGVRPFVQDCEVSKWTPDECPVTCGGGVQRLTRQVLSLASFGGAACPPLQMLRRCSEQRCPVDCQLAEWSSWSSCTARCSGGVRQRSRAVVVEASHGGRSCGASTEAEGCNLQACDSDCRLADWGDWSACSKMCNDGLQQRHRMVEVSAVGSGLCPDAEAPARLEYRPCNAQACALAPGRPTLQCASRLDVVLLLDGSASVQEAGWSAMLAAAGALAGALAGETGTRLGLLVFSGPSSFRALLRCTRGPQEGEPPPELELECGVRWVSHLTADVASVAEQIPRLAWPGGSALTSVALTTARSELRVARRDARSVVIVMTHARPMSPRMTGQAAAMVRESARLLWVPVAKYPPLTELSQWSSRPVRENVIHVPDFETLRKPTTVSSLIADLCPQVI